MKVVPITHRLQNKFGMVGVAFGLYCGFIIRDEYYYSSFNKISALGNDIIN
jgi:hypothetical protein